MRIGGGKAKGMQLKAPKGLDTRPTSDKVREAVFQTLGRSVTEARVLDLFAGSGALGVEALSRGAEFAVFVEKAQIAARSIAENLVKTKFREQAEIIQADFRSALRMLDRRGDVFHIILIDPPYRAGLIADIGRALQAHHVVVPQSIVVLEHFKKVTPPPDIAGIPRSRTRLYGQTAVSYYFPAEDQVG